MPAAGMSADIGTARVMVLGLGQLGMPLVQQLARLGVTRFRLADPDQVGRHDPDRLAGVTVEDVGLPRVIVAERLIRWIQPQAAVAAYVLAVPNAAVVRDVETATVVAGCFDDDAPRLASTALCSGAGVPYADLQLLGTPGGGAAGGRVVVAWNGTGCLSCLDLIGPRSASVPRPRAGDPSRMTVTDVVTSLAATEIMCLLTGLRSPARQLVYRGDLGSAVRCRRTGRTDCPYCTAWRRTRR